MQRPSPPISAGASCFLVISFKAFGNVVVDDESHIGLVDAHAKGDGSHNHIDVFFKKSILGVATHLGIQSCVIGARIDVVGAKHLGEFFHAFAREAVDDTTHMRVTLDESDDVVIHFSRLLSHFVVEVGSIKTSFLYSSASGIPKFFLMSMRTLSVAVAVSAMMGT